MGEMQMDAIFLEIDEIQPIDQKLLADFVAGADRGGGALLRAGSGQKLLFLPADLRQIGRTVLRRDMGAGPGILAETE